VAHRVSLVLILPCFVGGWLLGSTWFDQPAERASSRPVVGATAFYAPSLHPATIAAGQVLVTLLGIMAFGAKQPATSNERTASRLPPGRGAPVRSVLDC